MFFLLLHNPRFYFFILFKIICCNIFIIALTELLPVIMNNSNINKNFKAPKIENLDWKIVQDHMKKKLRLDIYESWLKKIDFVEEINNYVLLSVPTRFIRDWITSRYLDQILNIIRVFKKDIIRIEFKIAEQKTGSNQE